MDWTQRHDQPPGHGEGVKMGFRIGSKVEWTSQGGGYVKNKTGTIMRVLPVNEYLPRIYQSRLHFVGRRDHESYLVVTRKNKIYWPRVKHLREVRK